MPIYIVVCEYVQGFPYSQMGVRRIVKVIETTFEEARTIDLSEYFAKNIPIAIEWFAREIPNPVQEFNNAKEQASS